MAAPRPLYTLATITAGFHYRTKIVPNEIGEWRVAQSREVGHDLGWKVEAMPRVNPGPAERKARLKPGDVLVLARGERPYAVTVPNWPWPALASSSFYIVRPKTELILPEYLAWQLNTSGAVAALATTMRGAKIRWLPRDALLAAEIPLPSLVRQRDITVAAGLVEEESRLHEELNAERRHALERLQKPFAGGDTTLSAHIRLPEEQLDIVRERLARHFKKIGL